MKFNPDQLPTLPSAREPMCHDKPEKKGESELNRKIGEIIDAECQLQHPPRKVDINENEQPVETVVRSRSLSSEYDSQQLEVKSFGLTTFPPLPPSKTVPAIYNCVSSSVRFLNSFAASVDERLEASSTKMEVLEMQLNLLESKINTNPGLKKGTENSTIDSVQRKIQK